MRNFLEIVGTIIGVIGLGWAVWESHKRKAQGERMFFFLRGVKTLAESNVNNSGDSSAGWRSLIKQIDDINARLQK
jgi:hypothetical protein